MSNITTKATYDQDKLAVALDADQKDIIEKDIFSLVAYEDLIFSINSKSKAGKVAFSLIDRCTTVENTNDDVMLVWDFFV